MRAAALLTLFLASLLTGPAVVRAEAEWTESRIWRRARLLAPGQQVGSLQTTYRESSQRYSQNGELISIGSAYAKSTTWRDLLTTERSPVRKELIKQELSSQSLDLGAPVAVSDFAVKTSQTTLKFDWAYGLTSNWTVGFELPLLWTRTRVDSRVQLKSALRARPRSLAAYTSTNLEQRVTQAARQQLVKSGYDEVPQQKDSIEWGDVNLINRFGLRKTLNWAWSLQQSVRIPSARNPSLYDYVQLPRDDGQLDAGLTSLLDWRRGRWTLGSQVGYVVQMPDKVRVRLPSEDGLTIVDRKARRDLGDYLSAGADLDFRWQRRWNISAGYNAMWKSRDRYDGPLNPTADYSKLAQNTDQELHQARVGVDFLVAEDGVRQGIEEKWQMSLNFYSPIAARNSMAGTRSAVELIGYF